MNELATLIFSDTELNALTVQEYLAALLIIIFIDILLDVVRGVK